MGCFEDAVERAARALRGGTEFYSAVGEACQYYGLDGRGDFRDVAQALSERSAAKRARPSLASISAKIMANPRLAGDDDE